MKKCFNILTHETCICDNQLFVMFITIIIIKKKIVLSFLKYSQIMIFIYDVIEKFVMYFIGNLLTLESFNSTLISKQFQ